MSTRTNEGEEELSAGQMLGRYELLMPIAKGGMGNVWAARLKGTRGFRKLVAIKTILRTLERAGLEQMLYQEAVLASQIQHPNVAETLELGEHEGTLYLVMELVSGESLRFILREAHARGGIPYAVSINVIGQICRGLAAAHDLRGEDGERVGLVHRDISPPNVMITDAGTVKIVDFGVATTATGGSDGSGEIKGKLSYLAPEQLRGEEPDARVDVFATGILLYLLTVDAHPFRTASDTSTIARILSKAPATSPSVLVEDYPEALEEIVMRALQKDRQERFQSITELLQALQNAFPNAFGPRADETTASYLQGLMKERVLERKATLRLAEELAEKSSPRYSAYSLPAVTNSSVPVAKSQRVALLGLGGVCTGLGLAALAGTLHVQGLRSAAPRDMGSLSVRELSAAAATPLAAALPLHGSFAAGGASTVTQASAASPVQLIANNAARPRHARSSHSHRDETPSEPDSAGDELAPAAAPSVEAQPQAAPEPPPSPAPSDAPSASHALQTLAPANAFTPPPLTQSVPAAPRLLSSKVGQSQLLTNPASDAARVRLPAGLNRTGDTFSAVVNICVTAAGSVSRVNIVRSAGPALDPQIPNALSHWHYRPFLEAGKPTPFCYLLKYEIGAR